MGRFRSYATTTAGATRELRHAFTSRREELMHGSVDKLWGVIHRNGRTYLTNVSRDIDVQEAWFTARDGARQALGPVRPGERTEIRALRGQDTPLVDGQVSWRVRSMLLPWVSISREESIAERP